MSVVIDTETTGLTKPTFASNDEQPRVVEFAAILVNPNGEIVDQYEEIFNPELTFPFSKDERWIRKYGHFWENIDFSKKRRKSVV